MTNGIREWQKTIWPARSPAPRGVEFSAGASSWATRVSLLSRPGVSGLVAALLLFGAPRPGASASSAPHDATRAVQTTVCEILDDPRKFDGKVVRLRAIVRSGFEVFAVEDTGNPNCGRIWLSYEGGGPSASLSMSLLEPRVGRGAVKLKRDREFRRFQELVHEEMYPRSRDVSCCSCNRYQVTATLTGRLDAAGEGKGFGHLNAYEAQLELQNVAHTSVVDLASNYDLTLVSATPVALPKGRVRGRVVGPDGNAVDDAEVTLEPTEADAPFYRHLTEWTDEKGRFKFDDVPPGTYFAGVNLESPPSGKVPFPATYFPGTPERSEAVALEIEDGRRRHIGVRLGQALERVLIPVEATWPDGKPVPDANVWLMEVRHPGPVVGGAVSHTDNKGLFDLVGLGGIDYIVQADIYLPPSYTPYCSEQVRWPSGSQPGSRISLVLTRKGDVCRDEQVLGRPVTD